MFRGQRNRNLGKFVSCVASVCPFLCFLFTFSFMMKRKWEIITKIMLRYAGKFVKIGSRCAKTKDLRHKLADASICARIQRASNKLIITCSSPASLLLFKRIHYANDNKNNNKQ